MEPFSARERIRRRIDKYRICALVRNHGPEPDGRGVFNRSAPDTANREVLARYGTAEQGRRPA